MLFGPSPAPPPGTPSVLAGEARSQGGGGGRDQAQGPSRQGPQGQGNGPEGERVGQLDRSPDPGRQCPCGCPRPVVLKPPTSGTHPVAAGWVPTIMTPADRQRPQCDETHRGCPRRAPGASRGTARENRGAVAGMGSGLPGAGQGRDHWEVRRGGARRRRRRTRGGCRRGVCSVTGWSREGARRRLVAAAGRPPGRGRPEPGEGCASTPDGRSEDPPAGAGGQRRAVRQAPQGVHAAAARPAGGGAVRFDGEPRREPGRQGRAGWP